MRQGGDSVSHSSSCLCVCIHLFCFSALCPVWSRVHSQAPVRPKPGHSPNPRPMYVSLSEAGDAGALVVWIMTDDLPALLFF